VYVSEEREDNSVDTFPVLVVSSRFEYHDERFTFFYYDLREIEKVKKEKKSVARICQKSKNKNVFFSQKKKISFQKGKKKKKKLGIQKIKLGVLKIK
jgi:hypothetical protein